jgi:hypothetical protein
MNAKEVPFMAPEINVTASSRDVQDFTAMKQAKLKRQATK